MNGQQEENMVDSSVPLTKLLMKEEYPTELLKRMNQFRLRDEFTDAILVVDQEELRCHRCVLAASSPYFQATFSNNFQEAINARVVLRDISPWIMKRILDYIYTGKLEISIDTAQDYLKTGHMLQYTDIVDTCSELLLLHLHPSNCLGIKEFASLYGCCKLESEAYKFALEHFPDIIEKSDELLELGLHSMLAYLSDDHIDVPKEILLWKAIKRWVTHDYDNRKDRVIQLVSCLRFSALDKNELNCLKQDNLIILQPQCLKLLEEQKLENSCDIHRHESSRCPSEQLSLYNTSRLSPRPSTLPRHVMVLMGSQFDFELHDVFMYDPVKNRWKKLPSLPEKVVKASVTSTDSAIYVTGGIVSNVLSNKVWKFCCRDKRWSNLPSMLTCRAHHSSSVMNDILYVSGGLGVENSQSISHLTEIHALHLKSNVWRNVGFSSSPKMQAVLLGFNETLYELGGLVDECYTETMETYILNASNNQLMSSGEHYVLPCKGEPGPLRAVIDENNVIYILWENSGQLFSLNTNGRRFYELKRMKNNTMACLACQDSHLYVLGGAQGGRPSPTGLVYHIHSGKCTEIIMPNDCYLHTCVQTVM